MRSFIKYLLFLALIFLFSCDKMILFVKCSECTKEEPKTAKIEVKLDSYNPVLGSYAAHIMVYEGNLEDSVVLGSYSIPDSKWEYEADVNKKYTFTATYVSAKATYIAIDATYPRIRYNTDQCTEPCYYVYDKEVNLRLKYTAK